MEDFFRKMQLLGCIRLPSRVKRCKSEGVKYKLTPTLTSFWSIKWGKNVKVRW